MNSAAPKDFTPVVLTEAAQEWIIKHFKHTKNAEIAQRFGISQEWLHRFARKHGLKKTPQFFRKCQLATAQAAKASHLKNGTYPPKGFEIPNRHTFQKGHKLNPASEAKRKESLRRARAALMERERLRIALGEPQQTKIKLIAQPAKKNQMRYYLRSLGYTIAHGSNVAYYDENTRRARKIEARKKGDRNYFYFEFRPLEK